MIFLADENFHGAMLRGLLLHLPDLNIVRVQDTPLSGAYDDKLLAEAARQGAILITHDADTITKFAYDRIRAGLPMPGVIEVTQNTPIGKAVEDLVMLIGAGQPEDFENQIKYIPLNF